MNTMVHRLRIACTLLVLISGSLGGEAYGQGNPEAAATERVSVASDGTQANAETWWSAISADGGYVTFSSYADNLVSEDTNGCQDVFVHGRMRELRVDLDVANSTVRLASQDLHTKRTQPNKVVLETMVTNLGSVTALR